MINNAALIRQATKMIEAVEQAEADKEFSIPFIVVYPWMDAAAAADYAGYEYFHATTITDMRWVSFHDDIPEDDGQE